MGATIADSESQQRIVQSSGAPPPDRIAGVSSLIPFFRIQGALLGVEAVPPVDTHVPHVSRSLYADSTIARPIYLTTSIYTLHSLQ